MFPVPMTGLPDQSCEHAGRAAQAVPPVAQCIMEDSPGVGDQGAGHVAGEIRLPWLGPEGVGTLVGLGDAVSS